MLGTLQVERQQILERKAMKSECDFGYERECHREERALIEVDSASPPQNITQDAEFPTPLIGSLGDLAHQECRQKDESLSVRYEAERLIGNNARFGRQMG
jgi:hypothetical protein